jgi:hypothetical protein
MAAVLCGDSVHEDERDFLNINLRSGDNAWEKWTIPIPVHAVVYCLFIADGRQSTGRPAYSSGSGGQNVFLHKA